MDRIFSVGICRVNGMLMCCFGRLDLCVRLFGKCSMMGLFWFDF